MDTLTSLAGLLQAIGLLPRVFNASSPMALNSNPSKDVPYPLPRAGDGRGLAG